MTITLLSEDVINKIAAGEVIERPASVVKELLENSFDAGATRVAVTISDAGKELIQVSDNGCGMTYEDLQLCTLRHATSKITMAEDLFHLTTLGFRGEALASIAAVSELTITSAVDDNAYALSVVGGTIVSLHPVAVPQGTTISVKNLFFNTPTRKKFLKSDITEVKQICDIVSRYALLYPEKDILLIHNETTLLHTPPSQEPLFALGKVYGTDVVKKMLEVSYEDDILSVRGFIAQPSCTRGDMHHQTFFVNERYVTDGLLRKAVYEGYHSLLFMNRHPVFVLHLTLHPERIDVNIHPTKHSIKIEQVQEVFRSLSTAVRNTLRNNNLIPSSDFHVSPIQQTLSSASALFQRQTLQETLVVSEKQPLQKLPAMTLLGQIAKTFFLAETATSLVLIDQHVVEERINYEKFMRECHQGTIRVQELLQPELVSLSPSQTLVAQNNTEKLQSLGIHLEYFGGNTFRLVAVPEIFGKVQTTHVLYDILESLDTKNTLYDVMENILTTRSCRASIKAGDRVTTAEMEALLYQLDACDMPYTCPHGRPVLIEISFEELEKKFKRKG